MGELRESNQAALADYLDSTLPSLHPGSPDPDQQVGDKQRGASRVLLYAQSLERMESPEREKTHRLLYEVLMVAPGCRLAAECPLQHSAMAEFVFTSPAGYQAMIDLEAKAKRGDLLAGLPAKYCREGFEKVLDYLDNLDYELDVKPVPYSKVRDLKTVERRQNEAREIFRQAMKTQKNKTQAIKTTAKLSGYGEWQLYKLTADMEVP